MRQTADQRCEGGHRITARLSFLRSCEIEINALAKRTTGLDIDAAFEHFLDRANSEGLWQLRCLLKKINGKFQSQDQELARLKTCAESLQAKLDALAPNENGRPSVSFS